MKTNDIENGSLFTLPGFRGERVFIRRFWFDWSRTHRIAVIALKHKREITDREIRILKWTGALRRDGSGIKFAYIGLSPSSANV